MKLIFVYITFAISIAFISWIVAMLINAFLKNTAFYEKKLSNLNFVKSARFNKLLGLGIFKWIVKYTFFKFLNPRLQLKNKVQKSDLIILRNEMTKSEIDHLIGFAFVSIFAIQKIIEFNFVFAAIITIVNIFMNLYPSLLQQENKRRIDRFLKYYL